MIAQCIHMHRNGHTPAIIVCALYISIVVNAEICYEWVYQNKHFVPAYAMCTCGQDYVASSMHDVWCKKVTILSLWVVVNNQLGTYWQSVYKSFLVFFYFVSAACAAHNLKREWECSINVFAFHCACSVKCHSSTCFKANLYHHLRYHGSSGKACEGVFSYCKVTFGGNVGKISLLDLGSIMFGSKGDIISYLKG